VWLVLRWVSSLVPFRTSAFLVRDTNLMLNALIASAKDFGYAAAEGFMADHSKRETRRVSTSDYT
jgi:hypothetical protein